MSYRPGCLKVGLPQLSLHRGNKVCSGLESPVDLKLDHHFEMACGIIFGGHAGLFQRRLAACPADIPPVTVTSIFFDE